MENIENIENTFNIKLEGKHATSQGEIYAIVSKNKERQISRFTWYLGKNGYPFTYKRGSRLQLHKLIWILIHKEKPEKKMYIDHINRNKLDATDENLRPAEKFVLKPFRKDDESKAESMIKHGADALENILVRGLNHTMNHFNS